jgi:hypothetical protein
MTSIHDYSDILNIPRPDLKYHQRMPIEDRAAQFSPFAALTGFSGLIEETGRYTEEKVLLDDGEKEMINLRLNELSSIITTHPMVEITFFIPDNKKSGGSYQTIQGKLTKIDEFRKLIVIDKNTEISFSDIFNIEKMEN